MNHFDPRTSRALMERRLHEATPAARRTSRRTWTTFRMAIRIKLGERLIAFGERLASPVTEIT